MLDTKPVQTIPVAVRQGSEISVDLDDRIVNFVITEVTPDSEVHRLTSDGSWKDTKIHRLSDYAAINA